MRFCFRCYRRAGFPDLTVAAAIAGEAAFFAGGQDAEASAGSQTIALAAAHAEIDAGPIGVGFACAREHERCERCGFGSLKTGDTDLSSGLSNAGVRPVSSGAMISRRATSDRCSWGVC